MSQAPSMPMFWDAYIADTTHLTTEEHGAYLLLLAAMWRRNGWVPDDDRDNARILGLTPSKWRRIKDRLRSLLIFEDGHITQKNLLKIWKKTQEKIETNRQNGSRGGRPKSNKNNDIEKADGSFSQNRNETIPEPEPEPEVKERTSNGFDAFWSSWPNKVSKAAAQKAWGKLKPSEREEAARLALSWFTAWRSRNRDASPIHPASYLNGKRWTDQITPVASTKHRTVPRPGGPMERPFKIVK